MKVKFCCDNGANIHSKREEVFDTKKDFGLTDEEWQEMSDKEKDEMVKEWMWDYLEYWFEEE
jgi:hypothetical protein